MTTNGTHPEWQKAIRAAVIEQSKIDEENARAMAARAAEEKAEHEVLTRRVMQWFGIEGAELDGFEARIDRYEFTYEEDSDYGMLYGGMLYIRRADIPAYDPDLDINPPYERIQFPVRVAYHDDNDGRNPTDARAKLAAMIDRIDSAVPDYLRKVQEAVNAPKVVIPKAKINLLPSPEEQLLNAIEAFIHSVIDVRELD